MLSRAAQCLPEEQAVRLAQPPDPSFSLETGCKFMSMAHQPLSIDKLQNIDLKKIFFEDESAFLSILCPTLCDPRGKASSAWYL